MWEMILIAAVWLVVGIMIGRRSRKIPLIGKGFEVACAWFLLHEIKRHRRDIARGKRELKILADRGILPPIDIPLDLWLVVK